VFGIIRAPVEDLVFKGYTIPASALVVPDFDSVFMDPAIWTDPEVFRPDRFINEQGKLENKEEFLGFFTGEIQHICSNTHCYLLSFNFQDCRYLTCLQILTSPIIRPHLIIKENI